MIQPSLVSAGYSDSHLTVQTDQHDHLTQMGDFSADEAHLALPQSKITRLTQLGVTTEDARWVLAKSNDNVVVAADILFSSPLVTSARVRFESSQSDNPPYRPVVRGRGRGGYTSQPLKSSLSPSTSVSGQHIMVPAVATSSGYVNRDQLAPTLGKLADAIGNLGTRDSALLAQLMSIGYVRALGLSSSEI